MKPTLVTLLLLHELFSPVWGTNPSVLTPGRQVITAETIHVAGLVRIADILLLADEWQLNTADGLTWSVSTNGLSSFQNQAWIVMLDGQKMNLKSLETIHLNWLPVSLDQIDSVEIVSQPQIHCGEFTEQGLIHIHTRPPAPGIQVRGNLFAGDETGDPGPYCYTEYRTPNIDRIGLDKSATLDLGAGNWTSRIYLLQQEHSFTDIAMRRRIGATMADWPGMEHISAALQVGHKGRRGRQTLSADFTQADRYLLFYRPLGREIPVRYVLPQCSLNGNIGKLKRNNFTYRLSYSVNSLERWPNHLGLAFDWALHQLNANVEVLRSRSHYRIYGGFGWDRNTLNTSYPLEKNVCTVGRLYGGLFVQVTGRMALDASGMLSHSNGKTTMKGVLSTSWLTNSCSQIQTSISYSRRQIEEENSPWYWIQRGYQLLAEQNVDYTIYGQLHQSSQLTGNIAWHKRLNDRWDLEVAGDYRAFRNFNLERMSYQYNAQDYSFIASPEIYGDRQGQLAGFHVSLGYHTESVLTQRFYYSYQTILSGDRMFRQEWRVIRAQKASLQLSFIPTSDFSIWAMLSWMPASSWADYDGIDNTGYAITNDLRVTYHSTVQPVTILDAHIQKWFWHRRLAGSVLLRNLLNRELRYHPLGASFDLRFLIQIKLILGHR